MPYFRGEEELGDAAMERLAETMRVHPALQVGIILDEVQYITKCVECATGNATAAEKIGRCYFQTDWYNWQGARGSRFVRMDIASSHGMCARSALPSGFSSA
ncbi:MAG: hypothetical protein EOO65_01545 [Methanosarcinales archaeon]|nr:MAG: hypothetical protein EOO65_01545 [Methanosarcinales archaeon]